MPGHLLKQSGSIYGSGSPGAAGGGGPTLNLTATTTGVGQTVTLQRITPTGAAVTVNWGDGGTSTILAGNTGTTTHVYASAGTYAITITNPAILTYVDLRDTKLSANSSTLVMCTTLATLRYELAGTFNSADMATLPITYLYLSITAAGSVVTFNSTHISSMSLTTLILVLSVAGSYTFNSAHIAPMSLLSNILVLLHTTNTLTITRADWDGFPALATLRFEAKLTQAQMDAVLLGLWDGFATKTANAGTIDLLGQSNAAPSGTSPGSAECPPTSGYNAAYELVNDSCGVADVTKHWAAATLP